MTILWLITGAALVVACVAWRQARRTAKRLEQLTQMYWELKYQQGELRVQVQRGIEPTPPAGETQPPPAPPGDAFIPLASLKR